MSFPIAFSGTDSGSNGVVVLRGHGLQLLRRQDAFISVRHAGVGSGVVGGDGTGVGCRLSLQAGQLVLYGLELRVEVSLSVSLVSRRSTSPLSSGDKSCAEFMSRRAVNFASESRSLEISSSSAA